MRTDLGRYRALAFLTGGWLLIGCFVALPLKYAFDQAGPSRVVWTAHGWFYLLYLMAAVQLAINRRWPLPRTGLVLLAGTVPFLSFVMERRVMRYERERAALPR